MTFTANENLRSFLTFLREFELGANRRQTSAAGTDAFLDRINDAKIGLPALNTHMSELLSVLAPMLQASNADAPSLTMLRELAIEAQNMAADLGTVCAGVSRFYDVHSLDKTELKKTVTIAEDMKSMAAGMNERFPALPASDTGPKLRPPRQDT